MLVDALERFQRKSFVTDTGGEGYSFKFSNDLEAFIEKAISRVPAVMNAQGVSENRLFLVDDTCDAWPQSVIIFRHVVKGGKRLWGHL